MKTRVYNINVHCFMYSRFLKAERIYSCRTIQRETGFAVTGLIANAWILNRRSDEFPAPRELSSFLPRAGNGAPYSGVTRMRSTRFFAYAFEQVKKSGGTVRITHPEGIIYYAFGVFISPQARKE